MTGYSWVRIDTRDDYDQLIGLVEPPFAPDRVVTQLKAAIRDTVRGVLVEFDYIDKDYRSTYYRFYAKKGRTYRDDCVRLHFFDAEVGFDEATTDLKWSTGSLDEHYFGFIVLRPTLIATIGRSILSPDVRAGARGVAIQARHRVHLLGHTLSVWGFPSMAQHTDISVCAHVSCWAILRHYSERYPQHRELLLHDITMLAKPFDPGGITPAHGLTIVEAERIFQAAGTYPVIVGKRKGEEDRFYAQMLAYLESGFPLFGVMRNQKHAIVLVGYSWSMPPAGPPFTISHAWEQVESFLTIDDNLFPYGCVPVDAALPAPPDSGPQPGYSSIDLDGFVVPLPEKIFYPAQAVETQSAEFHKLLSKVEPLPAHSHLLRRYFVTTVSALRRFARDRRSELGDELVNMIMRLKTAQFVWVVEYASHAQWCAGHIAARTILDATASPRDPMPVWFAHGEQYAIHFDRSSASLKPTAAKLNRPAGAPLGRMEQNLRPIR
jgi:hypothetical protein